jgi:hypothetical protein
MNAAEHPESSLDAEPIGADQGSLEALSADAGATSLLRASGLYRRKPAGKLPIAQRDELRLDVDGRYPQRMASGVMRSGLANRLHWVARLKGTGPATWTGRIFYRDASAAMPQYMEVTITVSRPALGQPLRAQVAFAGGSATPLTQVYDFVSRSFDTVEFEFDSTTDAHPALAIQTHDHPNRPPGMVNEVLSIAKVYERAGFNVNLAPAGPAIPLAGAGLDRVWSDTEMHDAMQAHWSRFANQPQWALWVFHAALHESGTSLGGVMFDDIGPNHRQGTAIFTESFIARAPAGDAAPAAWVARMRFWTACHEMGHAFNLAHSWQKSLGTPWVPLADEPEARSFMNYPYNVAGGQTAFFADFDFRFSDPELQFLRHAPRRFVEMGNAAWFDHHGFEEASVSPEPKLTLVVRMNSQGSLLQFLEPAMIELKATNISNQPLLLPEDLLRDSHYLTLVVKRGEQPARQWHPYATTCHEPKLRVLAPGESMYAPVFVGAGQSGWLVAEPGRYRLQACLHLPDSEDVVSAAMELRIAPPAGYDEEFLAQDLFSGDVGRVLAFDGTRELGSANDTLREVVAKLPKRAVSTHANVALGMPLRRAGKVLRGDTDAVKIESVRSLPDLARTLLGDALLTGQDSAAATLGHVEFREYVETFAGWLAHEGDAKAGKDAMSQASATLEKRKVKPAVVAEMRAFGNTLSSSATARKPRAKK